MAGAKVDGGEEFPRRQALAWKMLLAQSGEAGQTGKAGGAGHSSPANRCLSDIPTDTANAHREGQVNIPEK